MKTLSKSELRAIAWASDVTVKRLSTKGPRQSRVLATINDPKRNIRNHKVRDLVQRTYGNFNPLNRDGVLVFASI
jgi:hypothetical protein